MSGITLAVDADGVATITWNLTDRPLNMMNVESCGAFAEAVREALADDEVKGIVVASARPEFIVGADLENIFDGDNTDRLRNLLAGLHGLFREMEKGGKPVVAAINGHALGGGLEVSLACHRRIVADGAKIKLGLPEAKLGILPGAGGTQRLPRLIGIQPALPLMLEGKDVDPQSALKLGIVDEVVPAGELLARARQWVLEAQAADTVQPWDRKGYKIPGGAPNSPAASQVFVAGNAMLRAKTYGNYPAQRHIMSCVFEGLSTDIDTGLTIELRYLIACVRTVEQTNLTRLFFSTTQARKLAGRPKDVPPRSYNKIGVLGAGMMGAGIAYVSALAGMEVVLIDTDQDRADQGKAHSKALLKKRAGRGRMSEEDAAAALARVNPTTDFAALAGADLVIEAVFEDRAVKAEVTKQAEAVLGDEAIFATNTSTLPITGLAEACARPEQFIGLHFFSPVDRMPLVEIIRGGETDDRTLAQAMDFVQAIGKTPVVVNDSRGFYTSRVFATYVREGLALLGEGVAPALIENAGRMAGMPVGPLALADEVSLGLMHAIGQQTQKDLGEKYQATPADAIVSTMVEELARMGKKLKKGFYDYPEQGEKRLWPGLAESFPRAPDQPSADQIIERLITIQSVEAARCMEENVVTSARDADVGAILGWGFAPFRGGPLSQIDAVGVPEFVAASDRLAQAHGPRFNPPELLRRMAAAGESFYGRKQVA